MSESDQAQYRASFELAGRLRGAQGMTAALLSDVIGEICPRLLSLRLPESSARIERLMKSEAWTDAVIALIELELPQWRLRRLVYDDGEWRCALSRERRLPDWLDQAVEYSHADLSLALLGAFIDAQRVSTSPARTSVPSVARSTAALDSPLCGDNYA